MNFYKGEDIQLSLPLFLGGDNDKMGKNYRDMWKKARKRFLKLQLDTQKNIENTFKDFKRHNIILLTGEVEGKLISNRIMVKGDNSKQFDVEGFAFVNKNDTDINEFDLKVKFINCNIAGLIGKTLIEAE